MGTKLLGLCKRSNKLVENILEFLRDQTQIEAYIVPTIEVVCSPSSAILPICDKYKIRNSEDQVINLEFLGSNIQWSKVAPDDLEDGNQIGGFVCKPSGNGKAAPSGRYSECINSIGFKKTSNNPDLYWWIEIAGGNDKVTARLDKKTIVSMSYGDKKVKFGNKDDIARLSSSHITGELDGQQGDNLIDLHRIKKDPQKFLLLALNNIELIFTSSSHVKQELIQGLIAIDYYGHNLPQALNIKNFHLMMGKENQAETILVNCNFKDINSQGGKKYSTKAEFSYTADHIIIPSYYYGTLMQTNRVFSNCHYNMTLRVEGNTIVDNYAVQGNFTYSINRQNEVTPYLRYINITLYNHIQNQFQIKLPYIKNVHGDRTIVQSSPTQNIPNTDLNTKVQHLFDFNHLTLTDIAQMTVKFNGIISNIQFSFANNLQVNITDLNITKSDSTYSFRDNSRIHLTKEGTYLVQYTNKSTQDVITNYPYNIVYRLGFPMIVFTGTNEVVYIGIGKDNIMRHVLTYPSHFFGAIGKNTYIIEPEDEVLTMNNILPNITVYGSSRPEQMNILDLSDVVRKITQDLKTETKLVSTKGQNNDILISLWVMNPNISTGYHNILVVKLSDAVASENNWCTKFKIILHDHNPMAVDCNTRDTHPAEVLYAPPSIHLSFNHAKIGIINSEHIAFYSELIVKQNARNYQFFYSGNNGVDLIITNIFDLNIEENEEYIILLKNFYKESNKMYTTTIRFPDKTISLQNETDAIEYSWPYYFQQKHFQANRYDILYLNELDTNVGHIPHRIRHHRHHEHHRDKRETEQYNQKNVEQEPIPSRASKAQPFITEVISSIGDNIDFLYGMASTSVTQVLNQFHENSSLELTRELLAEAELSTNVREDDIEDGYVDEDIEDVVPNKDYTKENLNTGSTKEQIFPPPPQAKRINREEISLSTIISTIKNNSEYLANIVTKTLYSFFTPRQKNCQVITNVKKDYKNGQASLIYSTYCENNDGVMTKTVDEKLCQLKVLPSLECTTINCKIEEAIECPFVPKYHDFSKGEKIVSTLTFLVAPIYLTLYTLYIMRYLSGNSEKEIRDCFFKHEEIKAAQIEEHLRQALICQNTVHEFEKILTNTKSKWIISQFNSIPVNILENINEPWLSKWYKIFGNNKWLSKMFGYKNKVTFFENLEHINNIIEDGIDITLENINEPWLSKWYKIFGNNKWLSKMFGYKDEEKICDEIYYHLLELDPALKNQELFYEDLKYTKDAIQDIKIQSLISKLQHQNTISKNQIEYLQTLKENIRELIHNKGNTTGSKYEQKALSELLNIYDNNNYQETTDNNYHDSTGLIGKQLS